MIMQREKSLFLNIIKPICFSVEFEVQIKFVYLSTKLQVFISLLAGRYREVED